MATKTQAAPTAKTSKKDDSTVVFGRVLEARNYLKTPKAFIYIRTLNNQKAKAIKARHIHLILVLAARKYKTNMIRRYWHHLGRDLGVSGETARKWAYELRDAGLINIIPFTGKRRLPLPKAKAKLGVNPGYRHDANGFDLSPLIELVLAAREARKAAREARLKGDRGGDAK